MEVDRSDAALVRRSLGGDTRAYADLVARYRDRLARYASHMLGDREDAEEALQDAFVRAYRSLHRCDGPERFGPWLFGILVNRCRTSGARAARRRRTVIRDEGALRTASVDAAADRIAWMDQIRWALDRLDRLHREAFLLKHVEDLEYEEMAALTGAGVSALKMRVKRACERLRNLLNGAERV
ncbi:MAG: RNA polymerase sigma factor [Gemmatimonadales bacterium]